MADAHARRARGAGTDAGAAALALRRAAREPAGTALPLLVVLLTMSMASFISTVLFTVQDEQARNALAIVGADYRVDAPEASTVALASETAWAGVETRAEARDLGLVRVRDAPVQRVAMVGVDTTAYAEVIEGTPLAGLQPSGGRDPLPALVADREGRFRAGDHFRVDIGARSVELVAERVEAAVPGLPEDGPGLLVALEELRAAVPSTALAPNRVYLRAPDASEGEVAALAEQAVPGATVWSREREYRRLRDEPLVAATLTIFAVGVIIATAYSALAVAMALVLTGRRRARDLAYLRTLGLSDGQATSLVAGELAVPAALATAAGVALGVAIARLTAPDLSLAAFTGGPHDGSVYVDMPTLAIAAAALAAVIALTVLVLGWFTHRVSLNRTLRIGDT